MQNLNDKTGAEPGKKGVPLIIWTLQRTGGTNLTQRLVERSGAPATEHEPFNLGRSFGAITAAWNERKDKDELRQAIRKVCQRRATIKHCVELVPAELSEVLLEEASAAGFGHLFLYRKQAKDRLLSLHFARKSGIWGPDPKTAGAPVDKVLAEPLPVAALCRHEQHCADMLTRIWEALMRHNQFPVALAFEDIYKVEHDTAAGHLLPTLSALGLSRGAQADREFVQQLLERGNQGTHEKYGEFANVEQLDRALADLRAFRPVQPWASMVVTRLQTEHPKFLRAVIDSAPQKFRRVQQIEVGGVVVLAPGAGPGSLVTVISGYGSHAAWAIASPKMKLQFPASPNSTNSRFHFRITLPVTGARLVWRPKAAGEPEVPLLDMQLVSAVLPNALDRIETLSTAQPPEASEYTGLRDTLDAAQGKERDAAWARASLRLDCVFRQNAKTAFVQLQSLRKFYVAQEDEPAFAEFFAGLQAAMRPYTLGPHGFMRAMSSREPAQVWRDIGALIDKLAAIGYDCFINSGTLLGAIRDRQLIAHDDDVDLGVVLKSDTLVGVVAEWQALKETLRGQGLLDEKFEARMRTHAKIGAAGGASVDLFPAWILDGRAYVWPHTAGEIPREALLPLKKVVLEAVELPIPQQAEQMLQCNYGPGWRQPDPSFRFDWQAATRKFPDFVKLLSNKGASS